MFSLHDSDERESEGVKHQIHLSDPRPFWEHFRCILLTKMREVQWHLQELLDHKIITKSKNPHASPIMIVCKKNGALNVWIDYCVLNSRTVFIQYTVAWVQEALDCLGGSKWLSVLDLRSGYYQITLRDGDKEKIVFICPLGFYQFERLPQGISGALATFQHLMEKVVGDMHLTQVLVYLDDCEYYF